MEKRRPSGLDARRGGGDGAAAQRGGTTARWLGAGWRGGGPVWTPRGSHPPGPTSLAHAGPDRKPPWAAPEGSRCRRTQVPVDTVDNLGSRADLRGVRRPRLWNSSRDGTLTAHGHRGWPCRRWRPRTPKTLIAQPVRGSCNRRNRAPPRSRESDLRRRTRMTDRRPLSPVVATRVRPRSLAMPGGV